MIDPLTLQDLSNKFGIDKYSILREYIQIRFLNELYSLPDSGKLVFKGGTALRLLFESNCFSEELDFTTTLEESDIKMIIEKVVRVLSLEMPGLVIKDLETRTGISQKLYLETSVSPQALTIKLDFSQRESVFLC